MSGSFTKVARSLDALIGGEGCIAAARAQAWLSGNSELELQALAREPVDFYPQSFQDRLHGLLGQVGQQVVAPLTHAAAGATTHKFAAATNREASPISGLGYYRIGEDGRLYVISKSEHYHVPLGHGFPGYRLLEHARRLGIPNATHNNTRGFITRLLEERLVRAANGLGEAHDLAPLLAQSRPRVLNRVLNLETGSLACEAALKMMLARFYRIETVSERPPYAGRTPVILVIGNDDGEIVGNYHGTTILTQTLRGMWPELAAGAERQGLYSIRAVRPNCIEDLEAAFVEAERAPFKLAGFFHEIIMMNYGARRLSEGFLRRAYELCAEHDVPVAVDEIQSCMWYDGFFLFREYGLKPDFVTLGKGFPGGEYPASRLIFSAAYDTMPQFGALVTNGQEELASLAYLVTMEWAAVNGSAIRAMGAQIENGLRELARRFPDRFSGYEGQGHLSALSFHDLPGAQAFARAATAAGYDIGVQTYKPDCPPVALTKLPVIADEALLEAMLGTMHDILAAHCVAVA